MSSVEGLSITKCDLPLITKLQQNGVFFQGVTQASNLAKKTTIVVVQKGSEPASLVSKGLCPSV